MNLLQEFPVFLPGRGPASTLLRLGVGLAQQPFSLKEQGEFVSPSYLGGTQFHRVSVALDRLRIGAFQGKNRAPKVAPLVLRQVDLLDQLFRPLHEQPAHSGVLVRCVLLLGQSHQQFGGIRQQLLHHSRRCQFLAHDVQDVAEVAGAERQASPPTVIGPVRPSGVKLEQAASVEQIGVDRTQSSRPLDMDLVVGRWWQITSAGVAMFVIVLALNIFGDGLRDALDPRLKNA